MRGHLLGERDDVGAPLLDRGRRCLGFGRGAADQEALGVIYLLAIRTAAYRGESGVWSPVERLVLSDQAGDAILPLRLAHPGLAEDCSGRHDVHHVLAWRERGAQSVDLNSS